MLFEPFCPVDTVLLFSVFTVLMNLIFIHSFTQNLGERVPGRWTGEWKSPAVTSVELHLLTCTVE